MRLPKNCVTSENSPSPSVGQKQLGDGSAARPGQARMRPWLSSGPGQKPRRPQLPPAPPGLGSPGPPAPTPPLRPAGKGKEKRSDLPGSFAALLHGDLVRLSLVLRHWGHKGRR